MYARLCLHTPAQVRSDPLLVGRLLGQQERPQWKEFGLGAAGEGPKGLGIDSHMAQALLILRTLQGTY